MAIGIYENFKNRDELFIALGQTYWAPIVPRVAPGATFTKAMHALAQATVLTTVRIMAGRLPPAASSRGARRRIRWRARPPAPLRRTHRQGAGHGRESTSTRDRDRRPPPRNNPPQGQ